MELIKPVKMEIEVFPSSVELLKRLSENADATKGEIVEHLMRVGIPITAERATEMLKEDIEIRTGRLAREEKQKVYLNIMRYIYEKSEMG